jgi:DNA-binding transcriptional LysR family regulator
MLDVTRLRIIDAVARHGSVTAAARELHYSQPSVTHHIARPRSSDASMRPTRSSPPMSG